MGTNNTLNYKPTRYNLLSGDVNGGIHEIPTNTVNYVLQSNGPTSQATFGVPVLQGYLIRTTRSATDYVVLTTDYRVAITSTASARAVTLPNPNTLVSDQSFIISDESLGAATNNITITPAAGLIDGHASVAINLNGGSITVTQDGTNYFIL